MTDTNGKKSASPNSLKRVLGLWDLIFYGIVLIQPIAAIGLFGIASKASGGHMVTTLMIAMVGMSLTAVSYGRMASLYPSAGSAYTYVGKGINPSLGFLVGWVMFLDYMIIPVINTIYASLTLHRLLPVVPFFGWVIIFVFVITYLNLRGIRAMARSNEILLFLMCAVILIFILLSIKFILVKNGWEGLLTYKPFYNADTFNLSAVMTATSFSALTYIGFDGVTTLAEEVKNPKRNMLLAPILVCLFTGLFSGIQIYLAQLVWPDYSTFPNLETAFFDVAGLVGGKPLFNAIAIILFIACFGSGLAGQAGAARLLLGMGRDGVIPGKIFSYLDTKRSNPVYNLLIMGGLTIIGALALTYQSSAELLNFGAFIAFMGVNIAAFRQYFLLQKKRDAKSFLMNAFLPIAGFIVCFLIWISLPKSAKILGGIWCSVGIIYYIIHSRLLKRRTSLFDFKDE